MRLKYKCQNRLLCSAFVLVCVTMYILQFWNLSNKRNKTPPLNISARGGNQSRDDEVKPTWNEIPGVVTELKDMDVEDDDVIVTMKSNEAGETDGEDFEFHESASQMNVAAESFLHVTFITQFTTRVMPKMETAIVPSSTEEPVRGEANIFFVETTCYNDTSSSRRVTTREACAIESAARANPDQHVYLLHTCQVVWTPGQDEYLRLLLQYPNVRFVRLNMTRFVDGTPVEEWWKEGSMWNSRMPIVHTMDIVRFLALWKYGGTYMDLDVVVFKSLSGLRNFVGADGVESIGSSIINFDVDETGEELASMCLKLLIDNYNPIKWGMNGPAIIMRALKQRCYQWQVIKMNNKTCGGFSVLTPRKFYLIPKSSRRVYLANRSPSTNFPLSVMNDSLAVHLWSAGIEVVPITVGSNITYGLLADRYCPSVYRHCGPEF